MRYLLLLEHIPMRYLLLLEHIPNALSSTIGTYLVSTRKMIISTLKIKNAILTSFTIFDDSF